MNRNTSVFSSAAFAVVAVVAALATAPAQAASKQSETSMSPAASAASSASPSDANRRLQQRRDHEIPGEFTLAAGHAPIADRFKPDVKFAGQAQVHHCTLHLPKAGQTVQPGEKAVITIECAEDWQLYDNGLSFDAFEGGKKVGSGTVRP